MYVIMLLCAIVATAIVVIWMFLYIRYKKQFEGTVENIDKEIFILKEIYFIGLGAIEIYEKFTNKRISMSEKAVEKMKQLGEVFGRDNAELYYYIVNGAQVSLIITVSPLGLLLVCIFKKWFWFVFGLAFTGLVVYSIRSSINSAMDKKKDAILSEFPKMVSKLTMLINAGMLVRRAWDEVAFSNYENALYAEMRFTSKDIQEGKSVADAMHSFAERCAIKEMRKFSSIYVQAVNRGAADSISSMKIMAEEAWKQKKEISKQKGETASQKLLIPNIIMFAGILAVVIIPMIGAMATSFK